MQPGDSPSHLITKAFTISLTAVGIFLRLYNYFVNRSFWMDEAWLALNITDRTFSGLLKPLIYRQGAPIGFLLIQKATITIFGNYDYTLRLFPILVGIAAVPLMYQVTKRYSTGYAPILSLGIFAFIEQLIYYSSEMKQYSSDVFATVVLLLFACRCFGDVKQHTQPHKTLVPLGVAGLVALWLSHPSVFILAGTFIALGLQFIKNKARREIKWLFFIAALWGLNLVLQYFVSLRTLAANNALLDFWQNSFMPMPPWNNPSWFYTHALIGLINDTTSLPTTLITIALLSVGCISITIRKWQLGFIFIAPFFLALGASALHKYPYGGRMVLFTVPLMIFLLAEGIERIRAWLLTRNRFISVGSIVVLSVYLLYQPVIAAIQNVYSPKLGEHIKPVLSYLSQNRQAKDLLYIYYGAKAAYMYYAPFYHLEKVEAVIGIASRTEPDEYLREIDQYQGNRQVWFLFSHNCAECSVNEESYFINYLDEIGVLKKRFIAEGASVYLYNLDYP